MLAEDEDHPVMATSEGWTLASGDLEASGASIERFERSLLGTTDLDTLVAHYADDAVRVGPFAPGLCRGIHEIRADLARRLAGVERIDVVDADLHTVSDGTLGCAYGEVRLRLTSVSGSEPRERTVRLHDVLTKADGEWRILHQHTSFPVDIETGTALTNGPVRGRGALHWPFTPLRGDAVPVEQARHELRRWTADVMRSRGREDVMQYFGPGDYVSVSDVRHPPGRMVGMWEVYRGWLPYVQIRHVEDELLEFRCWTNGRFAAVHSHQQTLGRDSSGRIRPMRIRRTDCLHRLDGLWYAYAESTSLPFDEFTGAPVF